MATARVLSARLLPKLRSVIRRMAAAWCKPLLRSGHVRIDTNRKLAPGDENNAASRPQGRGRSHRRGSTRAG